MSQDTLHTLLTITAATINDSHQPIIRVSAMKAIYCFCDELTSLGEQARLVPHLPRLTDGLLQLITQNPTNQIGFLTMETLIAVLGLDEAFVDAVEAKLSPIAIALFLKNNTDPMQNSIVADIIRILIANPLTNPKIEQRLVPTLVSIINNANSATLGTESGKFKVDTTWFN